MIYSIRVAVKKRWGAKRAVFFTDLSTQFINLRLGGRIFSSGACMRSSAPISRAFPVFI
jgi:hypothetical protein